MAAEVEQRASNGDISSVALDMDEDTLISRAERRPLTLSRCRNLYQAPEFVQRLTGDDSVLENSTVRFECKVKGFPKPTVKWYKDEEILELGPRISVESLDQGTFVLVIEDVIKKDEATYRCRIENSEGSSSSTIYLSVKGKSGSRSPKRRKSSSPNRRIVSYPSLFPTIEEKIVEEEKEEEEVNNQQPSPLSKLYEGKKVRGRQTWSNWAFTNEDEHLEVKGNEAALNPNCHRVSPYSDDDEVFGESTTAEITLPTTQTKYFPSHPSEDEILRSDLETSQISCKSAINAQSIPLQSTVDSNPQVPELSNTLLFSAGSTTCERTMSSDSSSNNSNNRSVACDSYINNEEDDDDSNNNNNSNQISVNRTSSPDNNHPDGETATVRTTEDSSATTEDHNEGGIVKDRHSGDHLTEGTHNMGGGVLTVIVLLTSFTFCALCIQVNPGVFTVSIFMATFMFQVIRQLNCF
ncbi:telokin-like [Argonauta hians]